MLLEFDLVHAEIRLINTADTDLQEWAVCVDGCTISEISSHTILDEYPTCSFIHACHYAANRFDISHVGALPTVPIRERPLRFLPYSRAAVLHDLNKISGGDLHVSDTFATGKMHRTAPYAIDTDRFISINRYRNGEKKGNDVVCTPFLMVEIDDNSIPEAVDAAIEWVPDLDISSVVIPMAESHIRTAQRALTLLCHDEVPPPFYVCYTGNRSFHMLWRFDTPIDPEVRTKIDVWKRDWVDQIKGKSALTEAEASFKMIDPDPLMSSTALVRIPCAVPEWSAKLFKFRHPQIAWHVTDSPTDPNRDVLNSQAMDARAQEAQEKRLARLHLCHRFTSRIKGQRQPLRNVSRDEVESALGKQ